MFATVYCTVSTVLYCRHANTAKVTAQRRQGMEWGDGQGTWEGTGITWKQKEDSLIQAHTQGATEPTTGTGLISTGTRMQGFGMP